MGVLFATEITEIVNYRSGVSKFAFGLVFVLALAACGPSERTWSLGSEVDPGATARFAVSTGVSRFDPHRATVSFDNTWLFPVYDRLIHLNPEGEPIPGLATEWAFGEQGQYLELKLRKDVYFHDGLPFDADAVAANIDRAKTISGSAVRGELSSIERVEVLGSHLVRFHLTFPDAALPLVLSDRAGMMVSPGAFSSATLDRLAVGAGPFRHVDFRPGHSAGYERFDDYWDLGAAGVHRLEILLMPDETTRLHALLSGQVQGALLIGHQVAQAHRFGLSVKSRIGLGVLYIHLNRSRSEFSDVRVRRALNYAVNREELIRALYLGDGQPTVQPFPEGHPAFAPDLGRLYYEFDPDRARALLTEAGLGDGFSFELLVPNIPHYGPLYEALHAQFGAVGIDVKPRVVEGAQFRQGFFADASGDAALLTWTGRPDPSQTLSLLFTAQGAANPGGHSTEQVERLVAAARSEIDPLKRSELLQAATREVTQEGMAVIISLPSATVAVRPNVVGMQAWLSSGKREFRAVEIRN